jgi:hypothetical protein
MVQFLGPKTVCHFQQDTITAWLKSIADIVRAWELMVSREDAVGDMFKLVIAHLRNNT